MVNFTTVQWSKTVSIKARTVQVVVSFESGSKLDKRQQALEKIIDSCESRCRPKRIDPVEQATGLVI